MNQKGWSLLLVTLLCAAGLAAADPGAREPRPVPNGRILTRGPVEADFAELERRIPGFAGWHLDAAGNAVVTLKDRARSEEAIAEIASRVEESRAHGIAANATPRFEVRDARYSFLQLAAFRAALYRDFPGDITSVDVDEVHNVLSLGVGDGADMQRVAAAVAAMGIPADAVSIRVAKRAVARTHIFEYHRPLRGGSQFTFRAGPNNTLSVCTLGVNGVEFNSSSYAGFVTASHCTQYPWGYTGNSAGQNSMATADLVATEYDDPEVFTHADYDSCPVDPTNTLTWGFAAGCRWSDAAFYRYLDSARTAAWGGATIHTTSFSNASMAYTVISGSKTVTGDASTVVGTAVDKIGATTGTTQGSVTATCIDEWGMNDANGKLVLLLCQDGSDLYNNNGDSGGPVYRDYSTYMTWAGILWGQEQSWPYYTLHSPAWAVRLDLPNFSY
ncbi:MAG TPA: hypothetical protein VJ276_01400 [Thermoanaerobaculia bacterium]|nr:hypothetical protein [Thermoanaerobaculia bacterium]